MIFTLVALTVGIMLTRDRSGTPVAAGKAQSLLDEVAQRSTVAVENRRTDALSNIQPVAQSPAADSSLDAEKTKRFREAKKCAGVVRAIESMRSQKMACDSEEAAPDAWNSCKNRIASFDEKLERAETMLSECSPADVGDSESRYWQSVVEAAKAGDREAALCFIQSNVSLQRPWSSEEVARYRILAPAYIDRAFSAGDWRIAEIFAMGSRGIPSESLLRTQTEGDLVTQYRMNRLLRLGAIGQYAMTLDLRFASPDELLTNDQRLAAQAWAKDMYGRYFSNSPRLESAPTPCAVIEKDIWPYPF